MKKWLDLRERPVEIAKTLRRFSWMVEVARQRPVGILHPYMTEVYMTKDGVGDVSLPKPAKGVLRTRRSREGGKAGAGV